MPCKKIAHKLANKSGNTELLFKSKFSECHIVILANTPILLAEPDTNRTFLESSKRPLRFSVERSQFKIGISS